MSFSCPPAVNMSSSTDPSSTQDSSHDIPNTFEDAADQTLPPPKRATKRRNYVRRRINMYLTDEVMPRPAYLYNRIKKSKKAHKLQMQLYLDNFDAIMELCDG